MVTLTTKSIRDFQTCEFYYKNKYLNAQPIPITADQLNSQRYESVLRKVVLFYLFKRQAGTTPSFNAILHRWEKLWFPKDMDAYDLAIEQHSILGKNIASYSTAASVALLKFFEDFSEDKADIIMLNENFLVPLAKDVRLEGNFDIVLRDRQTNLYRVIWLSPRLKRPNPGLIRHEMAAQRLAFTHRSDNPRLTKYYMYSFAAKGAGYSEIPVTVEDVKALTFWGLEAARTEKYVPRRGLTVLCTNCPFDAPCREFTY